MRTIMTILFLGLSVYMFFGPVRSGLADTKPLQARQASLEDALGKAADISKRRDELVLQFNRFSDEDKAKLEKLVPENVDNVRLIIDINNIASKFGMAVKNISLVASDDKNTSATLGPSGNEYTSLLLSFSVSGSYDALREFLINLEKSLRLADVENVSFTPGALGIYTYSISLRTYWLKPLAN